MPSFALAALVIALIASAGAVPLLRGCFRSIGRPEPVAGLALLVGVGVASFYMDPWPASALGLVVGALVLVVGGFALIDRRGVFTGRDRLVQRFEWGGTLFAALLLFGYLDPDKLTWSIGFAMLFVVALSLPLATAALDRTPLGTPALPVALALVEVLLLILFGAVNAPAGNRFALYQEFAIVALPAIGGLAGCLLYVARTPWRAEPAVVTGIGGKLALGLLVAWGVLRLGAITAEVRGGTTALLWLVCVPTFELIRSQLGRQAGQLGAARWFNAPSRRWLGRILVSVPTTGYSPTALVSINLVAGLAGTAMCMLGVSGYWMTLALAAFFAIYLAVPTIAAVQASRSRVSPLPLMSDGPRK